MRPPELIELTQLWSKWIKVYNEKLPLIKWHPLSDAVVSDYQINSVHVSLCPILLRNNMQHNSQRVRVHVHGGLSKACWGVFTNPRLYTQHTRGGTQQRTAAHALLRELGCRHQPQMRQLTCVSSPSVANYIRALRGYTVHTWKHGEMFWFCRRSLLAFLFLRQLQDTGITKRFSTETL